MKYEAAIAALHEHGLHKAVWVLESLRQEELDRRRKHPPKPVVSKAITADTVVEVKRLYEHTELTQHQIATQCQINQGRVSEIVNGEWDDLLQ